MFSKLVQAVTAVKTSIDKAANLKGNKEVLEGMVAAPMLAAYASGGCDFDEEKEAILNLQNDNFLKKAGYTDLQIENAWQSQKSKRPESFLGQRQLLREIQEAMVVARKLENPEIGENMVLSAVGTVMSDGTLDPKEKIVINQIAMACGVSIEKVLGASLEELSSTAA